MDDRRLRYFLAVVEEGSIVAAAKALGVPQSSLSQAIRALERELDTHLFHRLRNGARLTPAGEALVRPAGQILQDIDHARDAISSVAELAAGTLELAALAPLAADPMAGLIGRFRAHHPGIHVRVLESEGADDVRALVHGGECELGAAYLPLAGDQLTIHAVGEEELVFVFAPQTVPADGRPIDARELGGTPLVLNPTGTANRTLLEEALAGIGVVAQDAVEAAGSDAIAPLVFAGAGAALVPARLAREAERRGAIVRRAQPAITRTIGLIHRRAPLSPAARAFLTLATHDV